MNVRTFETTTASSSVGSNSASATRTSTSRDGALWFMIPYSCGRRGGACPMTAQMEMLG